MGAFTFMPNCRGKCKSGICLQVAGRPAGERICRSAESAGGGRPAGLPASTSTGPEAGRKAEITLRSSEICAHKSGGRALSILCFQILEVMAWKLRSGGLVVPPWQPGGISWASWHGFLVIGAAVERLLR